MKVLGLLGSPRRYGNSFKGLMMALKAAERFGAETEWLHLYELDVKPCLGCASEDVKACRYPCVIKDDMKIIYDKVLEADGIIFATPVYWYSPSAVMKNVIDRLTALENMIHIDGKSWMDGKVVGFVATGNDSGAMFAVAQMMSILNSMGAVIPPWSMAYINGPGDALELKNFVLDALNVGRSVVMMIKAMRGEKVEKWYDPDLLEWYEREVKPWLIRVVKEEEEKAEKPWKSSTS
ncbi:flavodoxin family protein [Ignicoccus hospitalis]|uniref:NADPH-dependent FMN reductase n=1 Tax=Ignicoccus hospitalis (strain KIN4/I / DSM 18386 / JCM 14125) TaxID=453591 RepID=A8AA50_IGNH4|nr:NAD(P)H-dependent oxidoreductase [Ignicoccus hospitalis]ABU81802.1 NADPH-dependent FMN reductase [Ignicoccus hospitalis KIN4/I]HIH90070.1 NAD(P)H-dependent oxidoreductase [Desulfurococcaceae archaeon]